MYNNECNKIMTCNNDKYVEVNFINDYIVFDTLIDEEYITINKIDDIFTCKYLNIKTTLVDSEIQQNKNEIVENNCILETPAEEICSQSLFFESDNKNNDLFEKNIGTDIVDDIADDTERDPDPVPIPAQENDNDDDIEEEEDINNQITEYKEELLMIETEINILNNIVFNMMVSNKKHIFNMRFYNKNNCEPLISQIKKLSERKKRIETTIDDIYKIMKTYDS